jgi:hypothetical protein
MILGLGGAQQEEVRREFGKELDLRLYDFETAQNPARWKSAVDGMDFIVVMIKHSLHRATDIVSSHKGYIPVNGGLSGLRNRLTELYVEGK